MLMRVRGVLGCVLLLALSVTVVLAEDDTSGMADNPRHKFWANFKPGAVSTYTQITKYHGPEKASLPDGVETKTIRYSLATANKDKVIVVTTVVEEDFLQTVESAPTRITFPAKVKKANLEAVLQEWKAKEGEEETIKVAGKEIKCKVRAGSHKIEGGSVEFRLCYSDTVPGGIVRHSRTTKDGEKIVAETTTTLVSFSEPKAAKPKEPAKPKESAKPGEK